MSSAAIPPSYEIKLLGVKRHFQAYNYEADRWRKSGGFGVRFDAQEDGTELIKLVLRPLPPILPAIVGDIFQTLRASLNHLVVEIARTNDARLTPKKIDGLEFPIFGDRPMNPSEESRKMGALPTAAQALIRSLQPHLDGEKYQSHPLWQLHKLANIDRHQMALGVGVVIRDQFVLAASNMMVKEFGIVNVPEIRDGSIMGWIHREPGEGEDPMWMENPFKPGIVFDSGPLVGNSVVETIDRIYEYTVREVIRPLCRWSMKEQGPIADGTT